MKKLDIAFILISLIMGLLCFISTNKIVFCILLIIFYVLDYFFILRKKFDNYFSLIERVHTSYYFINSFIITLSVKESFEEAYQNGIRLNNPKLKAQTDELGKLNIYDRVKYLRQYFNLAIYKMFLNILDLYQDQGGNILNMSDNLIRECTRTEKMLSETKSIGYKHLKEFIFLWILSFGILLFMRFSIKDFYSIMLKNPIISPLIFMFFIVCLISINLFVNSFTNLTIKEDSGT